MWRPPAVPRPTGSAESIGYVLFVSANWNFPYLRNPDGESRRLWTLADNGLGRFNWTRKRTPEALISARFWAGFLGGAIGTFALAQSSKPQVISGRPRPEA
jgi:hypothetical protein